MTMSKWQKNVLLMTGMGLGVTPLRPAALQGHPVTRGDHDAPVHAQVDAEVGTGVRRPVQSRGLTPHRLAAPAGGGQRAPTRASRSSPGECGRQTNVSASSTPTMRRCSASSAISLRAVSTSGSSGTPLFYSSYRGVTALFSSDRVGMLTYVTAVPLRLPVLGLDPLGTCRWGGGCDS